jgi:hypothetical protein
VKSVEFHPDAQDEFISAAQFYEKQTEGLGLDFILTSTVRTSAFSTSRIPVENSVDSSDVF